jgi:hypothetical protein
MMLKNVMSMLLAGFVAAFVPGTAAAVEIFRWVDENGVVHFSDSPPPEHDTGVDVLSVNGAQPESYDPEADIFNVEAQAERMQALREEREEARKARLERQRQEAARQPVVQPRDDNRGFPVYWNHNIWPRPPHRPRPPVRPEQPIERPPPTMRPLPTLPELPSLPD